MRMTSIIILVLMTTVLTLSPAQASPAGMRGTGEPNDPYQIATAEQLIAAGQDPNLLSKHFVLVADLDPKQANTPGPHGPNNDVVYPHRLSGLRASAA